MKHNIFYKILGRFGKSDIWIWVVCLYLSAISFIPIYSTTGVHKNPHNEVVKHFAFFVIAYLSIVVLHYIHYNIIRKLGNIALLLIFIGLVLLTLTPEMDGARRGLKLIGGFNIQPVEFIKVLWVVYVAKTLALYQTPERCEDQGFVVIMFLCGVVCLWIILISSASAAILIGVTTLIMLSVGRVRRKYMYRMYLGMFVFLLITIFIALQTNWRPAIGRYDTVLGRVERFFSPEEADRKETEAIANFESQIRGTTDASQKKSLKRKIARIQAKKQKRAETQEEVEAAKGAIATGGITGKGPGNSQVRYVIKKSESDYIFSIIVEELGFVLAMLIILSYVILVFRVGEIAKICKRTFPAFLVIGLATLIALQAFVNIAVAVDLIPVTGQTLPFVSKGGSSQVATGIAFGLILGVSYWVKKKQQETKQRNEQRSKKVRES